MFSFPVKFSMKVFNCPFLHDAFYVGVRKII